MYRCILVGLGGRGRYWKTMLDQHEQAQIVAFVEPSAEIGKLVIAEHGVDQSMLYQTLEEALARVEADFALDVTPPAVHHKIAAKVFDAGLHLLGEKPLSDNYATARRVVDLGARSGKKHMITQNYRFNRHIRMVHKLITEGRIGKPGQFDIQYYMPWADIPDSHYVTQPYMLINDMMVHHFDMMRYVVGVEPITVQAMTWNHPWGWHAGDAAHAIVFEFPENLYGTHLCIGCSIGQATSWNGDWRLEGPGGSISLVGTDIRHCHLHRTDTQVDEAIEPDDFPEGAPAILDEFFAALEQDREPECSAADNIHSVAMVFAAIKSAKEGRKVRLDELE